MSANASSSEHRCPRCGARLGPASAGGVCPGCLVAMNLAAPTEAPTGAEAGGTQVVKPPVATPLPLAEVARHFPQLEILECLGCGGMGVVYKARQPHLNRLVALKILAPDKEQDPAFTERFTREAQTLARLNHPRIVTLYDFGKVDGWFFLLLEYVDGLSLRQLLRSKRLSPEEALAIVPKICEALQYAHEHGVVHRDIKPENVLLNTEGRVKIADFGIAKIVSGETAQPSITQEEQVIGTPHYMAPEQVEHPKRVDHRADIYSLGVVFYEMLTGELPLGKFAPPSQRVRVDVRLDEVVLHALEKDPNRRYQHANEVKTDVETITTTPPHEVAEKMELAPTVAFSFEPRNWLDVVRICTRLLGTSLLLFFLVILGLLVLGVGLPPLALQSGGTLLNYLALALMALGMVVGWRSDGSAALLTGSGWALWHSSNGSLAWSMFHIVLLVAALYAFCWWAGHGRRTVILVFNAGALVAVLVCGMRFLPTNVYLCGTVLDAATHQPVPQAELIVYRPPLIANVPKPSPAHTLDDGYYGLRVGWYTPDKFVRVTAPDYAAVEMAIGPRLRGSRRINRDFTLSPLPKARQELGTSGMRLLATPEAGGQDDPETFLRNPWWGRNYSEKIAAAYSAEWLPGISNVNALVRLGFALYDTHQYGEALKVFSRLEEAGDGAEAQIWQGHMLDLLGRRAEAVAAYRKALSVTFGQYSHDQYGLVLTRDYVEQRLESPFARVENRNPGWMPEPTASTNSASNP
jgi:tRNA A-37 threonylcarbamoyl transferase component Bud32